MSTEVIRAFDQYLEEIGRERLLDREDEAALARRSRAGDMAARRRLVSANLRFVVSVARRYRGLGLPFADLVNEGNLGLVRAADRFDPERGVRFISYAHFWVRRAMVQALRRHEERPLPGEPPPRALSLDHVAPGTACSLAELLPDERAPEPGARVVRERLRDAIEASLSDLPPREREVVRRYFGIGLECAQTLAQISADLNVSRERVRQLKERGLSRLRAVAQRHRLDEYVDSGGPGSPGIRAARHGSGDMYVPSNTAFRYD